MYLDSMEISMPNYLVSYDLNGPHPTHGEIDQHLRKAISVGGRILETVWHIQYEGDVQDLFNYIMQILSPNDRLLVVRAEEGRCHNLIPGDLPVINTWNSVVRG
jgi:hypothetical protein